MMPTFLKYLLSIAIIISCGLPQSEAQILNKLKRKLEEKIEQKGEEEIDKELSKEVDKELNQDTSLRSDTSFGGYDRTNQALLEGLMGSKLNVDDVQLPKTYEFKMSVTYEIQVEDEKPNTMKYLLPKSGDIMGFEMIDEEGETQTKLAWDLERDVIVMYQEDKKGNKSLQKLPNYAKMFGEKMQERQEDKYGETTVTKTGNTEMILGYLCEEYILENDETKSHIWIAPDFPYDYSEFAALMQQQMQSPGFQQIAEKGGFALKMQVREKDKKGETTTMIAKEVNEREITIDNSAYEGYE